jgi:hypothetical protein
VSENQVLIRKITDVEILAYFLMYAIAGEKHCWDRTIFAPKGKPILSILQYFRMGGLLGIHT